MYLSSCDVSPFVSYLDMEQMTAFGPAVILRLGPYGADGNQLIATVTILGEGATILAGVLN